jgi:hypothetical protein
MQHSFSPCCEQDLHAMVINTASAHGNQEWPVTIALQHGVLQLATQQQSTLQKHAKFLSMQACQYRTGLDAAWLAGPSMQWPPECCFPPTNTITDAGCDTHTMLKSKCDLQRPHHAEDKV